jgi:hypothetical protein
MANCGQYLSRTDDVPAGLIMRVVDSDIEVFVSSQSEGNPYSPRDKEVLLGSGLYCETVLATKRRLLIPNALRDEDWKNNPDIKLNMISYLGYPILWPDGAPFGTICVLDRKENAYSETYKQLLLNFQGIIQSQLELLHVNKSLGEENKSLQELVEEMRTLREIVPICSFCKKYSGRQRFLGEGRVLYHEVYGDNFFAWDLSDLCQRALRLHSSPVGWQIVPGSHPSIPAAFLYVQKFLDPRADWLRWPYIVGLCTLFWLDMVHSQRP